MVSDADFEAWLRESCSEQGVGIVVEDPQVLQAVEVLMRGHG